MQSNADRELELELEGADCEEKIGMMQRLQGREGGGIQKYGKKEGKERKGENITGLSSRPSYGDERWGAEERSNKSLHYMVSQGTWGN